MFSSSEVIPIFMTRLVDERGGIIQGGLAQVGRLGSPPSGAPAPAAALVEVGVPAEDELDLREVGDRLGAHLLEPGDPV